MALTQSRSQHSIIVGEEEKNDLEGEVLRTALDATAAPDIIDLAGYGDTCGTCDKSTNLQQLVINSLQSSPSSLPALLLWDDIGNHRFDILTQHPRYYPSHTEMSMIYQHAEEIASVVPAGSTIIELGCGNLKKTGIILSAMERLRRPVTYRALDVSVGELQHNLTQLSQQFMRSTFVTIQGLHGTYDDCAAWLAAQSSTFQPTSATPVITFLWLGNSIANMQPQMATGLLDRLHSVCLDSGSKPQFIISADTCADPDIILNAYSPDYQAFTDFTSSGLGAANRVFGQDIFQVEDFRCETAFDVDERLLRVFYVANRRVERCLDVSTTSQRNDSNNKNKILIEFEQGQRIPIIHSYKWSRDSFDQICQQARLKVKNHWRDDQIQYCEWSYDKYSMLY